MKADICLPSQPGLANLLGTNVCTNELSIKSPRALTFPCFLLPSFTGGSQSDQPARGFSVIPTAHLSTPHILTTSALVLASSVVFSPRASKRE